MQIDLESLEYSHPLRNTSLVEIGAKYRKKGTLTLFPVGPAFGIAKVTYNQLGKSWKHDEWFATQYSEDWQSDERDRAIAQNGNVGYGKDTIT